MYLRSETSKELQRRYLELKKHEANYESQISSLKYNKQCS